MAHWHTDRSTVSIEGGDLNKTTQFKYLRFFISFDSETFADGRVPVVAAWLKWRQVAGALRDNQVPNHVKGKSTSL